MLAFLVLTALGIHGAPTRLAQSSAIVDAGIEVETDADSSTPTALHVRILESPVNAVTMGGAFVWSYASLRGASGGSALAVDLGTHRAQADGTVRIDLAPLSDVPPLDRAVCQVRVAAYRDGVFAEKWFTFDELLAEPRARGSAVFGRTPDRGEPFRVGRVVNESGRPVEGVEVVRVGRDAATGAWDERDGCCGGRSDALGYFVARVPEGDAECLAVVDPVHGTGWVAASPDVSSSTIVLRRTGAETTGRIVDAAGDGVPFARFVIVGVAEESDGADAFGRRSVGDGVAHFLDEYELIADERGAFRLFLPAGSSWWILSEGHEDAGNADPLIVRAGTADSTVSFGATRVRVRLRDEAGRLLNGVTPRLHRLGLDARALPGDARAVVSRGMGTTPTSDPDGGWSLVLEDDAPLQIAVWRESGDRWFVGSVVVRPRIGRTADATVVVRDVARAQPLDLMFVDADGRAVSDWTARLLDAETERMLITFDADGVVHATCFGLVGYGDPRLPVGAYRVAIEAEPTSFVLPATADVHASATERTLRSLRSPGFGGRLLASADSAGWDGIAEPAPILELVPDDGVDGGARAVRWTRRANGGGTSASMIADALLEPGTWSYTLRAPDGAALAAGTVEIRAREETVLAVEIER